MRLLRLGGRVAALAATFVLVALLGLSLAGYASATLLDRPAYRFPSHVEPRGALTIAVVGDSLARGMRASTPQRSFVGLLFARVAEVRPGSRLVNVSAPGARLREIPGQVARLPDERVDLVLMVAVGNDVMAATDPLSLARDERAAFDAIGRRFPAAPVLFTNVPDVSSRRFTFRSLGRRAFLPPSMRLPLSKIITFDNALVENIGAHRQAGLIDLEALSRTRDANDARFISPDGLHPNDAGHARLADFAWPAFATALAPPVEAS